MQLKVNVQPMPKQTVYLAILAYLVSLPLLLGSSHVGAIIISAQFTRGLMIGAGVMLDAFATVWAVKLAHGAGQARAVESTSVHD